MTLKKIKKRVTAIAIIMGMTYSKKGLINFNSIPLILKNNSSKWSI